MTLSLDRARELLDYDPLTGVFRWRISKGLPRLYARRQSLMARIGRKKAQHQGAADDEAELVAVTTKILRAEYRADKKRPQAA